MLQRVSWKAPGSLRTALTRRSPGASPAALRGQVGASLALISPVSCSCCCFALRNECWRQRRHLFGMLAASHPECDRSGVGWLTRLMMRASGRVPNGCSHTEFAELTGSLWARHNLSKSLIGNSLSLPDPLDSGFAAEQTNNEEVQLCWLWQKWIRLIRKLHPSIWLRFRGNYCRRSLGFAASYVKYARCCSFPTPSQRLTSKNNHLFSRVFVFQLLYVWIFSVIWDTSFLPDSSCFKERFICFILFTTPVHRHTHTHTPTKTNT